MTTLETFEHIARRGTAQAMVDFLLPLTKQDLLTVRQHTRALYREMNNWSLDNNRISFERAPLLFLAGVASFSRKEAATRAFDLPWSFQNNSPANEHGHWALLVQLLQHTRPVWFTEWLLRITRSSPWQIIGYPQLRELADAGLVEYDGWLFAQSLAQHLTAYSRDGRNHPQPTTAEVLRFLQADATLLQRDLPLLFDFDTMVDSAAIYRQQEPHTTWLVLLPELAASGHLQRADLLSRSLLALRRDFRRPLLTWFKSLFLALNPTLAERLAFQADLVDLLAHPLPLVVNFALDQLRDLWAQPDFAAEPLLLYAESLLIRQDIKTGLRTLFGGLEKLLKRDASLAPSLAALASTALAHADSSIQERAAKLLKTLLSAKKPLLTPTEAADISAGLCLYLDLLAPAARALLSPYLPLGDDELSSSEAAAYVPQSGFVPDISGASAVAPVRDWHELLFLTGQVVQQPVPAQVERWLDGLLRLRGQYPAGYAQQLQPYLLQAFPWLLKGKSETETRDLLWRHSFDNHQNGQREMVLSLLISWYLGFVQRRLPQVSVRSQQYHHPDPLLRVEHQRLTALEEALWAFEAPLPLLSTPTHMPHWVAPSILVQKLLDYEAAGQEPNPADLCLALARTAVAASDDMAAARNLLPLFRHPELRQLLSSFLAPATAELRLPASLAKLPERKLADRLAQLIPFLRSPTPAPITNLAAALPALWVVAARTRHLHTPLPALRHCTDYPGVEQPWQPTWTIEQKSHTYKQAWNKNKPEVTEHWQELTVNVEKPNRQAPSSLLLYSLHAGQSVANYHSLWSLNADLPFLLTLLPNHPDSLHWHLIRIGFRTNQKETASQDAMRAVLHAFLQPGPVLTEPATLLLALGLTHAAPGSRALALEVLLAAITNGRLEPETLGTTLARLLTSEFAPVQRLTDSLSQARTVSAVVDDALRQILNTLLPLLPGPQPLRNTRKLLEIYADVQGRTRQAVPSTMQQNLRIWSSSAALKKATATLLYA